MSSHEIAKQGDILIGHYGSTRFYTNPQIPDNLVTTLTTGCSIPGKRPFHQTWQFVKSRQSSYLVSVRAGKQENKQNINASFVHAHYYEATIENAQIMREALFSLFDANPTDLSDMIASGVAFPFVSEEGIDDVSQNGFAPDVWGRWTNESYKKMHEGGIFFLPASAFLGKLFPHVAESRQYVDRMARLAAWCIHRKQVQRQQPIAIEVPKAYDGTYDRYCRSVIAMVLLCIPCGLWHFLSFATSPPTEDIRGKTMMFFLQGDNVPEGVEVCSLDAEDDAIPPWDELFKGHPEYEARKIFSTMAGELKDALDGKRSSNSIADYFREHLEDKGTFDSCEVKSYGSCWNQYENERQALDYTRLRELNASLKNGDATQAQLVKSEIQSKLNGNYAQEIPALIAKDPDVKKADVAANDTLRTLRESPAVIATCQFLDAYSRVLKLMDVHFLSYELSAQLLQNRKDARAVPMSNLDEWIQAIREKRYGKREGIPLEWKLLHETALREYGDDLDWILSNKSTDIASKFKEVLASLLTPTTIKNLSIWIDDLRGCRKSDEYGCLEELQKQTKELLEQNSSEKSMTSSGFSEDDIRKICSKVLETENKLGYSEYVDSLSYAQKKWEDALKAERSGKLRVEFSKTLRGFHLENLEYKRLPAGLISYLQDFQKNFSDQLLPDDAKICHCELLQSATNILREDLLSNEKDETSLYQCAKNLTNYPPADSLQDLEDAWLEAQKRREERNKAQKYMTSFYHYFQYVNEGKDEVYPDCEQWLWANFEKQGFHEASFQNFVYGVERAFRVSVESFLKDGEREDSCRIRELLKTWYDEPYNKNKGGICLGLNPSSFQSGEEGWNVFHHMLLLLQDLLLSEESETSVGVRYRDCNNHVKAEYLDFDSLLNFTDWILASYEQNPDELTLDSLKDDANTRGVIKTFSSAGILDTLDEAIQEKVLFSKSPSEPEPFSFWDRIRVLHPVIVLTAVFVVAVLAILFAVEQLFEIDIFPPFNNSGYSEIQVYTVTFDYNGGTPVQNSEKAVPVSEGVAVPEPQPPIRDGYVFQGWLLDGATYDFDAPVRRNITLTADWQKERLQTFRVTFESSGNSVEPQDVELGKTVVEPEKPKRDGYLFRDWLLNGMPYDFSTQVTENLTLQANWIKAYTVSFNLNYENAPPIPTQTIAEGAYAEEPEMPTREGYTFHAWMSGETEYSFNSPVQTDITLTADWTKIVVSHTVTFDVGYTLEDGSRILAEQTILDGETAEEPPNPSRQGHDFVVWQLSGMDYDFTEPVKSNLTLKALWVLSGKKTHVVTFTIDGLAYRQTVEEGLLANASSLSEKLEGEPKWISMVPSQGYDLPVYQDFTLYGTWPETQHIVTLDSTGGNPKYFQIPVNDGERVPQEMLSTKTPTRSGYVFRGWYTDRACKFAYNNALITEDTTLYAKWEKKSDILGWLLNLWP